MRLHFNFSTKSPVKRIEYAEAPFVGQLPSKSRVVTNSLKGNVASVQTPNYKLTVALYSDTGVEIVLENYYQGQLALNLFYTLSRIEEYIDILPFCVTRFPVAPTRIDRSFKHLRLDFTITPLYETNISYHGSIPVYFKVK